MQKGQHSAIKIFKIDTLQITTSCSASQASKITFSLTKTLKLNISQKLLVLKRSKFWASTPIKDNRVFTKT